MTAHYCTYFDDRYLTRGLALYESMRRHCAPFRLWVLCMSDECYRQISLLGLPDVVPLKLNALETALPSLAAVKSGRSLLEYYFTCTPALLTWLFDKQPQIDTLTYLDADLYFFSSPDRIFQEFSGSSVLIVPHRFSRRNEHLLRWGIYNVGWVGFRRDTEGLRCLRWWYERCVEWCYDIEEADRFADQKYLDRFPRLFGGVQIDENPGVNLAPWNLDNYRLSKSDAGVPLVDGAPLVFFHFHGLRRVTSYLWRTAHHEFGAPLNALVRHLLYRPYLEDIAAGERRLGGVLKITPLRRDSFKVGAFATKFRAVGAIIWRGCGVWIARGRVL